MPYLSTFNIILRIIKYLVHTYQENAVSDHKKDMGVVIIRHKDKVADNYVSHENLPGSVDSLLCFCLAAKLGNVPEYSIGTAFHFF